MGVVCRPVQENAIMLKENDTGLQLLAIIWRFHLSILKINCNSQKLEKWWLFYLMDGVFFHSAVFECRAIVNQFEPRHG